MTTSVKSETKGEQRKKDLESQNQTAEMVNDTLKKRYSYGTGNYAFCGWSEDDPRTSSMGRRRTEATPFGRRSWVLLMVGKGLERNREGLNNAGVCLDRGDLYTTVPFGFY